MRGCPLIFAVLAGCSSTTVTNVYEVLGDSGALGEEASVSDGGADANAPTPRDADAPPLPHDASLPADANEPPPPPPPVDAGVDAPPIYVRCSTAQGTYVCPSGQGYPIQYFPYQWTDGGSAGSGPPVNCPTMPNVACPVGDQCFVYLPGGAVAGTCD